MARETRAIPLGIFKVPERIWGKVRKAADGCWIWHGQKDGPRARFRYGRFEFEGQTYMANRIVYELEHGPGSSSDLFVLHRCKNTLCVNPDHLYLGTDADNQVDRVARGNGKRVLEALDVLAIRRKLRAGHSVSSLALEYGVVRGTIRAIRDGKTWKHLLPDPNRGQP